jgi:hypothetical protein
VNNGHDDETTPIVVPIKNADNRGLAAVVANFVLEGKAHFVALRGLYEELCTMEHKVPQSWSAKLAEEQERHIQMTQLQIPELRRT